MPHHNITMKAIILLLNLSLLFSVSFATVFCPLHETSSNKIDAIKSRNYYECPGQNPKYHTECCNDNRCCPMQHPTFYQIDQHTAFMVAFCVSLLCLIFSIFLMLCCFCPICPLYNACRVRYTRDDAGCAHKMGDAPLYTTMMPLDSPTGNTVVIAHPFKDKPNGFISDKYKEAAV